MERDVSCVQLSVAWSTTIPSRSVRVLDPYSNVLSSFPAFQRLETVRSTPRQP
jgi:hypothetical protein